MKIERKSFFNLLFLNAAFLFLMSIYRLIFFLYYGKGIDFSGLTSDIIKAFYTGLRFDLGVIAKLDIPIFLVFIVLLFLCRPLFFKKFLSFAKFYYTVFFGFILIFLRIDFSFYSYFQNHINILAFGFLDDDTAALISTFHENYNLIIVFLSFCAVFIFVYLISHFILKCGLDNEKLKVEEKGKLSNWSAQPTPRSKVGNAPTNNSQELKIEEKGGIETAKMDSLAKDKTQTPSNICNFKNLFNKKSLNLLLKILFSICAALLLFAAARGSLSTFPLEIDNADVSSNLFLNKTAINAFYTFDAAITERKKEKAALSLQESFDTGYKDNIYSAFAGFLNTDINAIPNENPENSLLIKLPPNKDIENLEPNVILIIMESFGSDLLQYNSASFNLMGELKKHFDEDLVFYNFLPGSGGTAESVEVILANMPKRPYSPVLSQSKNAYKKYNFGAAVPYQNNKYETAFIYGGGIGWRKMGAFSLNLGFDKAIGAGSMDDKYPRNQWGVYDEHLLDYAFNYLRSSKNKKFIAVLTTTNHPPYSLPKDYKHMPLKIPQELDKKISNKDLARKRFEVYQYANDSVGKFISRIKNSEFAQNTIIAITGDHNFWGLYEYEESQLFNSYKVPFYLYIPKKLKPKSIELSVFGDHLDIMPTLYGLSLQNTHYLAMGADMFSKNSKRKHKSYNVILTADSDGLVKGIADGDSFLPYRWKDKKNLTIAREEQTQKSEALKKYIYSMIAVGNYLIENTGIDN